MREVPLPAELVKRLKVRDHSSDLIFAKNGKPHGHMLRVFKALAKKAGVDPKVCGLHVFRKTFATRLHRAGVGSRTIQKLLGHSDLVTTLAYLEPQSARSEKMRALGTDQLVPEIVSFTSLPATPQVADTKLYVVTCSNFIYGLFAALRFMNWCLTSAEMGAEGSGNAAEGLLARIVITVAAPDRIGRVSQFSSFAIGPHKP